MRDHALRPWPKREAADLSGQRFGLIQVVRMAPSTGQGVRCLVRCDCGQERYALAANLRSNGGPTTHLACRRARQEVTE